MKAYNKHIALFLLVIISAFIVPKELVHALYEHEDTVHTWSHNQNGLPALENEHQHCEILNINAPQYFFSINFFCSGEKSFNTLFSENSEGLVLSPDFNSFSHRGPPAC